MDQRRTQRYQLELPLYIFQLGHEVVNEPAKTRDISSGGVCFLLSNDVEVGARIDYMITLSSSHPPVRIRCLGNVLRSQSVAPDEFESHTRFEVAVTMDRYSFVRSEEIHGIATTA